MTIKNKTFQVAGQKIEPGTHEIVQLPAAALYTQTEMAIPAHVFHGKYAGPKLFVTSAIHGDELNSIEIIRRLHNQKWLKDLHGTLITIPVVNSYGFIIQSRYLPDRRDLNRSFPGRKSGSLAARLAHIITEEIISKSDYGIDLHTGAFGRVNLPQLRVNLESTGVKKFAQAFEAPVIIDAKIRDGSLRQAASELGVPILVYEGGEALRFNELCIRMGVRGIGKVMNYLKMISVPSLDKKSTFKPVITQTARWVRATTSGFVQPVKDISKSFTVKEGEILAYIHDPFLINPSEPVVAPFDGILIGLTNLPILNEGDAIYNIASTKRLKHIGAYIEELKEELDG
ncbi:MAG: succinylglutamate desuccinylase/aspartoacylase family protein [Candidatus Berkiella sp.]